MPADSDDVQAVEAGSKPIALVRASVESVLPRIEVMTHLAVLVDGRVTMVSPYSQRIYYRPETESAALADLLVRPAPEVGEAPPPSRPAEWHRRVGLLLGYSAEDIDAFLLRQS